MIVRRNDRTQRRCCLPRIFLFDHQSRRLARCGLIHIRQSYVFCSKFVFNFCGIADHALV